MVLTVIAGLWAHGTGDGPGRPATARLLGRRHRRLRRFRERSLPATVVPQYKGKEAAIAFVGGGGERAFDAGHGALPGARRDPRPRRPQSLGDHCSAATIHDVAQVGGRGLRDSPPETGDTAG